MQCPAGERSLQRSVEAGLHCGHMALRWRLSLSGGKTCAVGHPFAVEEGGLVGLPGALCR